MSSTKTNKMSAKKKLVIILLVVFSPVIIFALMIAYSYISDPFLDRIDHDKFAKLDSQMQGVLKELKTASKGVDNWGYKTSCEPEFAGDFQTGKYFCTTLLSAKKNVTTVSEAKAFHEKYYPIIDNNGVLEQKTNLTTYPFNDFGNKFVVSSVEQEYNSIQTNFICKYSADLRPTDENLNTDIDAYGSELSNNKGVVDIEFDCSGKARDYWYTISNSVYLSDPDAPLKKE